MRLVWLAGFALVACGHPQHTSEPAGVPAITPRLPPPPPIVDLDAPDAAYRVAVALQLQPGWAQFLDDCRLRLPVSHPLNAMALAATAEIGIDAAGRVVDVHVESSGNVDYDRAVRQVIEDAAPLPRPPRTLWADDDLVHVRWLFARDRRQAGPATARVVPHDLRTFAGAAELGAFGLVEAEDGTTNALALPRASLFAPLYGAGSADRFRAHAEARGVAAVAAAIPNLADDVDTLEDLAKIGLRAGPRTQTAIGRLPGL